MRKIVLAAVGRLEYQQAPIPELRPGWVRVKTLRCGLCGTDVHNYYKETIFGKDAYPFNMGHEVCGLVDGLGEGVQGLATGDKVVVNPIWTCGACRPCQMGMENHCERKTTIGLMGPSGNSEYTLAPASAVVKADPDGDPDLLAFTEPVATVLYGLDKLRINATHDVLIVGAGAIGLIFLQLLKNAQLHSLTVADVVEEKLTFAKALGADDTFNMAGTPEKKSYDVIIDCTGSARVIEQDLQMADFGAQILIFGVCPIDSAVTIRPFEIYNKDLSIFASYTLTPNTFQRALHLIQSGRLDVRALLAGVYPVGELERCIQAVKAGKVNGKIVIDTTRLV